MYAHDKEQANSAISILSRYYRAVERYFQWLAWDKDLAKNSVQNYLKDQPGLYNNSDPYLPDSKYEVPIKTQHRLLRAIDGTDYYRMDLDAEFNGVVGSGDGYQDLINMLWPDEDIVPDSLNVHIVSLAIINTIRGVNLDEEARQSIGITEATDAIVAISRIEKRINRFRRKEKDRLNPSDEHKKSISKIK